jgi:hypothetical protein
MNSNNPNRNRNRDLPVCSAVRQPTAPPRILGTMKCKQTREYENIYVLSGPRAVKMVTVLPCATRHHSISLEWFKILLEIQSLGTLLDTVLLPHSIRASA